MGLSINSFDLMALIESLQNLIPNEPETPMTDFLNNPAAETVSFTEPVSLKEVLQEASTSVQISEDVLKAAIETIAQNTSVTEMTITNNLQITPAAELPETDTPAPSAPTASAPTGGSTTSGIGIQMTPIIQTNNHKLDEDTRRIIDELIRSLQLSVVHSYQSTDIIGEDVTLNTLSNSAKANKIREKDNREQSITEEKRRTDRKTEEMREELRRAILKNNTKV
ncbi:MAG: hypothetical protein LUM44_21950 [Pyrinomonadaceae bacterium]|nr:hypothetical protein [Pyrinomonadaceae bacterium]